MLAARSVFIGNMVGLNYSSRSYVQTRHASLLKRQADTLPGHGGTHCDLEVWSARIHTDGHLNAPRDPCGRTNNAMLTNSFLYTGSAALAPWLDYTHS